MSQQRHSFPPVAAPDAKVLILGSMPGEESLRLQQYYAFSHNAFWRIMGELFSFSSDLPYAERLQELQKNHIALWDTLSCCIRSGSLDSNIRNAQHNDITGLLLRCPEIRTIFCNGHAAYNYLKRFQNGLFTREDLQIFYLPSTSPAAARMNYHQKLGYWKMVAEKCR